MEKLKMHSPDMVAVNIEKIAALFPNCITEAKDNTGKLTRAVDFDLLRQELSGRMVEGPQERYRLDWPGKREALFAANAPIAKTLRPVREESVNFDITKNLFIEGDNLDALKLLQESYLGSTDLIYIDPPYNTGREFIYRDRYSKATQDYLIRSAQKDEEGMYFVANAETEGRFHSDWLSMMYPRIKLCRNLLKPSGIFICSCDDHEEANLRKICDEVFGTENRLDRGSMIWKSACSPRGFNHIVKDHEFLLAYARDLECVSYDQPAKTDSSTEVFDGQLWIARTSANPVAQITFPAGLRCEGPDRISRGQIGSGRTVIDIIGELIVNNGRLVKAVTLEGAWPSKNQLISFLAKKPGEDVLDTKGQKWVEVYFTASNFPFVSKERGRIALRSVIDDCGNTGTPDLKAHGLEFSHPKPVALLEKIIKQFTRKDALIIDFFAGSSTTAEAVFKVNSEGEGNRRFIMIQVPGEDKASAEKSTLSGISRERIKRAGMLFSKAGVATLQFPGGRQDKDFGFRSLVVASSNYTDSHYLPDDLKRDDLLARIDNIHPDRSPEDLLFQIMLDWGLDLGLPISSEKIAGKTVYFVDGNALAACFETDISEELVTALAKLRVDDLPLLKVVFRDAGYADDSAKINVEQIFKLLSPTTELRTL